MHDVERLEQALDDSERVRTARAAAHLAALVESSADAIISEDLDGVVRSRNRAAELMFGFAATR